MEFPSTLQEGVLIKRYKRFLTDIKTSSGETITIHCPNTGSMKNCQDPDSRVWYSDSGNPKRKYPCTWQIVEAEGKHLVGINTGLANKLVEEGIGSGAIKELQGYSSIRREVPYGEQKSRIDILLEDEQQAPGRCYVEIKNVSLGVGNGLGLFPDAVTTRGQKHLQELMTIKKQGDRAVLLFCVQHEGINEVKPADEIDPDYGKLLRQAAEAGVEVLAYGAEFSISKNSIALNKPLTVSLD